MRRKAEMIRKPKSQPYLSLGLDLPLSDMETLLFPKGYKLLPLVRQKYEFELAAAESRALSPNELIKRGAYFMSIGGELTYHYLIAQAAPLQVSPDASETRKAFFDANRYSVAYATHGLFPYRGKFHPQMIKAIINIIGLKPQETLLDPMVGSGTTLVEAALMGINSIGIELNPFTVFMSKVKLEALDIETEYFSTLLQESDGVFKFFKEERGYGSFVDIFDREPKLKNLALLAYLDTLGYAVRRKTKTAQELYPGLLKRYLDAVEAFNKVRSKLNIRLGSWLVLTGDARNMPLDDASLDGIIFSPPYSFALDYVENDRIQLDYLGVEVEGLKQGMIGLRGEGRKTDVKEKVNYYFEDMDRVFKECARVLKKNRHCVVVIGSNTQQTGGVRLEKGLIELAKKNVLPLCHHMVREIEGIRNTMREEHILFFQKA
mgnify:CR=1 FL=1